MDNFKIGFKTYNVVKQIDEQTFIATQGKKTYYVKNFNGDTHCFYSYYDSHKKFDNTGIKHPKIKAKDKKRCIIVLDYIEGENALDLLLKGELEEKVYEKIFFQAFVAKIEHKSLNYDPDLYIFSNGELYYMSSEWYDYNDESKFTNRGIRLWFHTKEFMTFAKDKGKEPDKSLLKEDYEVNKQIVLMTCKYYR
ncbi:MAG: hypothetical protein IJQ67_04130 [Bacilli bacterium]|nr:hypothetical protein [Bacilli bacterium]